MIIGSKIFDCQHGPDRKKSEKAKSSTQKEGDHSFSGRRFLPQDTIKFGCPAKILMSEVIKFPGYKILDSTKRIRRDMSDRLKGDIKNRMWPQFGRRIHINLPMEKDHKDHVIGEV
ncbi:uncharacterized protein LOC111340291 [Stylophora pistillata]|uniref:uncharacterized protein LOC111340291 n=1 Tax=Stylophora pistillata TaxID=50429 RepID=UPI000C03EF9F|nr:uncharacterized protein LOC111340291 [Stylophora pistillata]